MQRARLTRYGLLSVTGADARAFLHAQLTNDIENLPPERWALAGWCSAKGRLLASFLVIPSPQGFLLQLAGEAGGAGRQIAAQTLDIAMAPDGMTPTALTGRESVQLTFPAAADTPARTIQAAQIDAKGEADRGLTSARFKGDVMFRERGPEVNRAARSAELEIAMKPGMTSTSP